MGHSFVYSRCLPQACNNTHHGVRLALRLPSSSPVPCPQLACRLEHRKPLTLGEATQIVRYDPGQVGSRRSFTYARSLAHCALRARAT